MDLFQISLTSGFNDGMRQIVRMNMLANCKLLPHLTFTSFL